MCERVSYDCGVFQNNHEKIVFTEVLAVEAKWKRENYISSNPLLDLGLSLYISVMAMWHFEWPEIDESKMSMV